MRRLKKFDLSDPKSKRLMLKWLKMSRDAARESWKALAFPQGNMPDARLKLRLKAAREEVMNAAIEIDKIMRAIQRK